MRKAISAVDDMFGANDGTPGFEGCAKTHYRGRISCNSCAVSQGLMGLKGWQKSCPHLFKKKVINHSGPDSNIGETKKGFDFWVVDSNRSSCWHRWRETLPDSLKAFVVLMKKEPTRVGSSNTIKVRSRGVSVVFRERLRRFPSNRYGITPI